MKHTESKLQENCVKWFRYAYPQWRLFLVAVPNGAFFHGTAKQRAMQWRRLSQEGSVEGVSDLILFDPFGKRLPLFIEMKRPDGKWRQEESQVHFMQTYRHNGYTYEVVDSFDKFEAVVMQYVTDANL